MLAFKALQNWIYIGVSRNVTIYCDKLTPGTAQAEDRPRHGSLALVALRLSTFCTRPQKLDEAGTAPKANSICAIEK